MDDRLITAIVVVVGVPGVLVGYIWGTEQGLRLFGGRMQPRIRPWLWLLPALGFLGVFLVYPTIGTIIRSLQDKAGTEFVGLANYAWFFSNDNALSALKNNVLWVVFLTVFTVGIGLLISVLVDRVRYESVAKSVIFVPLAVSMVAAGVIWKFMYEYRPPGEVQIGTLNAALGAVGTGPVAFLQAQDFSMNTFALIAVMTWMWTGFAMVILSAALKGVPAELLEAARMDGATEVQVFQKVVIPTIRGSIIWTAPSKNSNFPCAPIIASRTPISRASGNWCRRPRTRCSRRKTSAVNLSMKSRKSCRGWAWAWA